MKKIIFTTKAPKAVGPYSQAVVAGDYLFISGQIPIIPLTGEIITNDFQKAVHQTLINLKNILESESLNLSHLVKVRVYLKNIKNFEKFNTIYQSYFTSDPPARAVIEVSGLPKNVEVEIEATAYLGS